jgi:hypothetical protein
MSQVLHKTIGPIGKARYHWISHAIGNDPLYQEIKANAIANDFKLITEYDNGYQLEFTIEAKNEAADALFVLTWADHIDFTKYENDKNRKFPADWITKVLYYTVRNAERSLPLTLLLTFSVVAGPTIASKIWNVPYLGVISALGMTALMTLVFLRSYDDIRQNRHEQKQRQKDEEEWEKKFASGGLHETF